MKTENHYTETDLGNISLNPRGEYDPEAFYEYLDTVSMDGGSYMCLAELGTKITGTPPVPGINTEHWQVLTLPGSLTPEYIAMHDEVIEKAKQVEISRAAVELSQSEIEAMQADVAQLHKDTQDSAQSALASKNQAAGYASAADTSRQAAERAKQDVDAQIPNIDAKLQAALNEIDITRQGANTSVKKQEELSVQAVKDQTGAYITEQKNLAKQELDEKVNAFGLDVDAIKKQVSDEGTKQVEAVQDAQNTATKAVETAKTEAVQAVQTEGTTQTRNVTQEGEKQVQAVQAAAQEIVEDREQIQENKAGIETLKQGKADAIVDSSSGENITLVDSGEELFRGLRIFGKSTQDGVPSPENPKEITSIGDDGDINLAVYGKNLLDTRNRSAIHNGVTFKADQDGVFSVAGATGNEESRIGIDMTGARYPADKYTFLAHGLTEDVVCRFAIKDTQDSAYRYVYAGQTVELDFSKYNSIILQLIVYPNKTVNANVYVMLYKDGDRTFEPYREPQSLTISTPNGLPGIKVDSDGNYTDNNGQQWVCDEIDLARGKYVQRVKAIVINHNSKLNNLLANYGSPEKTTIIRRFTDLDIKKNGALLCRELPKINNWTNEEESVFSTEMSVDFRITRERLGLGAETTIEENNAAVLKYLETHPLHCLVERSNITEYDIDPEEIVAYKALHTNYPTTIISNDENAHMEVSYVADTKNYIDKKFKELSQAIVNTQIALL